MSPYQEALRYELCADEEVVRERNAELAPGIAAVQVTVRNGWRGGERRTFWLTPDGYRVVRVDGSYGTRLRWMVYPPDHQLVGRYFTAKYGRGNSYDTGWHVDNLAAAAAAITTLRAFEAQEREENAR